MRKILILTAAFIIALFVMILCCQTAVFAVEPYELLPVDVVYYPNHLEICKIYEMKASVNPSMIPRDKFKRDDIQYECTDILREVKIGEETKKHIEVETIDSTKNDIETILKVLPLTKEVLTEDGFFGVLYLNTSTIKSEVSGYGSTSSSVSITRTYPNLYDKDTQYIPKSVTENNITYTLADIQWQADNTYNVDDYGIGNRYTAVALYSGTKTSSYVKGYKVTAEYSGELCRTGVSVIRYTVIFSGSKIEPKQPAPIPETKPEIEKETETEPERKIEPDPEAINNESQSENDSDVEPLDDSESKKAGNFNWLFVIIPLALLTAAAVAGVIYMYLIKKKERPNNEETTYYDYIDTDDSSDSDPGDSDGV